MDRYQHLLEQIRSKGSLAIAYSGGVDSSFLALAAREALGDRTLAMMAVNETITDDEMEMARCTAREIGIRLIEVQIDVLGNSEIVSNPLDRCGICKHEIMSELMDRAIQEGFGTLADGSMPEDRGDHRPGIAAADGLGIWHPLMESEIDKSLAREVLKDRGISSHDRPSTTCLMTRIPYGQEITKEKLEIVERLEKKVRDRGFKEVRLRLHGTGEDLFMGVLEVDDPSRALDLWDQLGLDDEGVRIVLDPKGYRQGSLNEGLSNP